MPEPPVDRNRLFEQRDGKLTLTVYEQADRDGNPKRFWTLTRDVPPGEKPLLMGGTMGELAKARDLIDQAEQFIPRQQTQERTAGIEREAAQSKWLVVVTFETTESDGALARVVRTYPQHERHQAEKFVESLEAKRQRLVLVPTVIEERPVTGDTMVIPHGMSKATDRQIAELGWQETNGKRFTMGVWYEQESGPREGEPRQLVKVGSGREGTQGGAELRKIVPLGGPITPGEGEKPVFVVVELDEKKVGRGRIVAVHHDHAEAIEHAKSLEQNHRVREQVNGPEWRGMSLYP